MCGNVMLTKYITLGGGHSTRSSIIDSKDVKQRVSTFFLERMYHSILSFETINKLKLFFECGIPRPQYVGHLCLRYCNFLNPFYNLNCSA
jgi:hypothetical protein